MLNMQKTIHFYGRSEGTEKDELGTPIAYATMDATILGDGNVHINKNTASKEAYEAHAEEIEKDWAAFEEAVHAIAQADWLKTE